MTNYENVRLINTVLNLYYLEKFKQSEIAERLGLSTPKVNRLLHQARELGYIEFVIRTPFQHLFDLEEQLKSIFGLQEAVVIPAVAESNSSLLNAIGFTAANFLLDQLDDGDVVAITPGTTVQAVVHSMEDGHHFQVEVVPILGAVQGEIKSDMNYLATHLAERIGAKSYQLHAPAFVDTPEQGASLRLMSPVKDILDIARQANIALLGIGTVDPDASRFVQFTALSAEDMQKIANMCGGIGEIAAYVYDIEGKPCCQEYADRVIGLSLAEIQQIPFRVGVAVSEVKALPIYGALRGGFLSALITDETAARGVLELYDRISSKTS